ncbi:MAG: hypothetical protein C0478_08570 [Planctomyces sp.]|nr:hypothetical protein [Planctomyces sp.]
MAKRRQKSTDDHTTHPNPSHIYTPNHRIALPLTPFETRMLHSPLNKFASAGTFDRKELEDILQRNPHHRIEVEKKYRRLKLWAFAQTTSGSGLAMSRTLLSYFSEYLNRLTKHGPGSLPMSFNVVESFLEYNNELLAYGLRQQIEHLLAADTYFDWYSNSDLPRDPILAGHAMEEGVSYEFNMVSDHGGYKIQSDNSTIVINGISLVRHGSELSCILLAGENPAYPSNEEIQEMERSHSTPAKGRSNVKASEDLTIKNRFLDEHPSYSRIIMLTRFDIQSSTFNARYVHLDCGRSFTVLTDDLDSLNEIREDDPASFERIKLKCMTDLARYNGLFSALASLIYLPVAFVDSNIFVKQEQFTTSFATMEDRKVTTSVAKEFDQPTYSYKRVVHCLAKRKSTLPNTTGITPPKMKFEQSGFWRQLEPGQIGKDADDNPIVGRTWVARHDNWSAEEPSTFLLERTDPAPTGSDPGTVYVVRSPAHGPDIFKIGLTRRPTEARLKELSNTSTPLPFEALATWPVGNCAIIESAIHKSLQEYRINSRREFFRCNLMTITAAVTNAIEECTEI